MPVIVSPALATLVESATVMFAEPSKDTPLMVLAVASLVAVAALPVQEPDEPEQLPVIEALIVAGNFIVAFPDPSNDAAVPVLVAEESCTLIVLAVASLVAVAAFPCSFRKIQNSFQ